VAILTDFTLSPDQDAAEIMRAFEEREANEFVVTEGDGKVLGVVSERYVRRRYTDEIEKAQRELFGE
jgi:CIC family chloride channel protein